MTDVVTNKYTTRALITLMITKFWLKSFDKQHIKAIVNGMIRQKSLVILLDLLLSKRKL